MERHLRQILEFSHAGRDYEVCAFHGHGNAAADFIEANGGNAFLESVVDSYPGDDSLRFNNSVKLPAKEVPVRLLKPNDAHHSPKHVAKDSIHVTHAVVVNSSSPHSISRGLGKLFTLWERVKGVRTVMPVFLVRSTGSGRVRESLVSLDTQLPTVRQLEDSLRSRKDYSKAGGVRSAFARWLGKLGDAGLKLSISRTNPHLNETDFSRPERHFVHETNGKFVFVSGIPRADVKWQPKP